MSVTWHLSPAVIPSTNLAASLELKPCLNYDCHSKRPSKLHHAIHDGILNCNHAMVL